jgi:hypothetical protein
MCERATYLSTLVSKEHCTSGKLAVVVHLISEKLAERGESEKEGKS